MGATEIREIVDAALAEPAPFLPLLHSLQERRGYLAEEDLACVSETLRIPLAELFGTVTFYHYFRLEPPRPEPRLCGGPACALRGPAGEHPIACPGRCDTPVARFTGETFEPVDCRLPPGTGRSECLFAHIRDGGPGNENYRRRGGWQALRAAERDPEGCLEQIKKSGLVGRGGAGFPTGVKWEAVRKAEGEPKYVVCNADEGEPGCFKDRALLNHDPLAVLEGMAIAGKIVGSTIGILYLRYEYPDSLGILKRAIREAENEAGGMRFFLRRGAGAYICGEETSLLNSLEGKRPFPREKPPYPTTHGLFQKPTLINNVETFAAVPPILRLGADSYRGLGRGGNAGTKIFSVSGDVARPGNYELPLGTPLPELLALAGAENVQAVTMAGVSGGFLAGADLGVPLDLPSVRKAGSMLGAGGIIVYDNTRCMVRAAWNAMSFFAHESCGKCFPCRIGTTRLTEILDEVCRRRARADAVGEMREIGRVMATASACGLGLAAPFVTESLLKYWPEEVEAHRHGRCPKGECLRISAG